MFKNAVIAGTGAYLPSLAVGNNFYESILDTDDEWIYSRTGIKERRFEQELSVHQMMANAAEKALGAAKTQPGEIDLILGYSSTADYAYPSAACLVQGIIGAENAFAYDVAAACASFVVQLDLADLYIKSGRAKTVLIVTGDIMTRHSDYSDRGNCILFGDGAGAAVVKLEESDERRGVLASWIHSETDGEKTLAVHKLDYRPQRIIDPSSLEFLSNVKPEEGYIQQNGREVFKFAVNALPKSIERVLEIEGLTINDISRVIAHQANARILASVAEKYNLDGEKLPIENASYGNMSTTTITVLLDEFIRAGKIKKGDRVIFSGFGSGLIYGANLVLF